MRARRDAASGTKLQAEFLLKSCGLSLSAIVVTHVYPCSVQPVVRMGLGFDRFGLIQHRNVAGGLQYDLRDVAHRSGPLVKVDLVA